MAGFMHTKYERQRPTKASTPPSHIVYSVFLTVRVETEYRNISAVQVPEG